MLKFPNAITIIIIGMAASIVLFSNISAQSSESIVITIEPNQNIRDISAKYLDDPDLWMDILRANNIGTAADLKPGMKLTIPAADIKRASSELDKAQSVFQEASKSGARIFAAVEIDSGYVLFDAASEKRRLGEWLPAYDLAHAARALFDKALKICETKKDLPGEASLFHRLGNVQSRKQVDPAWLEAHKGDVLIEGEKVRTLSKSAAEIQFKDESKLRLEENSQALIQEMRENLLEKKSKSTVSLINGDLYALLGGQGGQDFNLTVPGVETEINSSNFRVGRDEKKSKFANYEGELAISSAGAKVVLQANQGSVVEHNKKPSAPKSLLPRVKLAAPEDGKDIYDANYNLTWESLEGAARYRIEVAEDKQFSLIVYTGKIKENSLKTIPNLSEGIYYWRALAYDRDDLAGLYSQPYSFVVVRDDQPPYLIVSNPPDNHRSFEQSLEVMGEAEPDCKLTIDGNVIDIGEKGTFKIKISLQSGLNELKFMATDPAGNQTSIIRKVTYRAAGGSGVEIDPSLVRDKEGAILVADRAVNLQGVTGVGNTVTISEMAGNYSATVKADESGKFVFNIPLIKDATRFMLLSVPEKGAPQESELTIKVDDTPPKINIDKAIPEVTGHKLLEITGSIEEGAVLTINLAIVDIVHGKFSGQMELSPGANEIAINASDAVGNETTIRKTVNLDVEPPELVKHEIDPPKVGGGEQVKILVYAKDASALKKAAVYTVAIGDFNYQGYLQYMKSAGRYEGVFGTPADIKGTVNLKTVTLQDKNGNKMTYNIK